MRDNGPVTQRPIHLSDQDRIFSVTTHKGVTNYANDDFVRISQFTREELEGEAANRVRHPDMPRSVFREVWQKLSAGGAWVGVVKNRAKNGDHYWVNAYMMAVEDEDGQVTECQSVRFKPDAAAIDRAERVYARMRSQERSGNGFVDYRSAVRCRWPLSRRLPSVLGLIAAPTLAVLLHLANWHPLGVAVAGLAAITTVGASYLVTRPVDTLASHARRIIDDPVQEYIETGRCDEIGAIDMAIRTLENERRAVAERLASDTRSIRQGSTQANAALDQASQIVNRQSDEVTQVATAMNQMTVSAQEIARLADEARSTAAQTDTSVAEGSEQVVAATQALTELTGAMETVGEQVRGLHEQFSEITEASQLIENIAKQTQLLALNASIEAARAGEQGKGFAVVAEEVQALAQQVNQSSHRIRERTIELGTTIDTMAREMDQRQRSARAHAQQAERAAGSIDNMRAASGAIESMSNQVASAAEEQTQVAQEIDATLVRIAEMAQDSSDAVETSTREAAQVAERAGQVTRIAARMAG
ncbi:methyl-accepting chemotaxis sensory transducer with Pas/Pac sensor [Alkalispirillum mobile]|uniref:Methyl-accepting chemotaxis sensory transducer with Pas/Pac sensor n=1 Tax=Alkalispirillum mobile TaxID=85925 RepID=A0A498BY93_9GAMM|nr:PAS domain-containing methyl-accepting chemotaxis protein [Alkalispirillum mobile]RLK48272.1 methyl-accepting chemotaxis sensory transducer with Pas/Pac sensor [Alkalispirillum mobile]